MDKRQYWIIIYGFFYFTLVIAFILSILFRFNFSFSVTYLSSIETSMQSQPIYNIKETTFECESTQQKISFGLWPGTVDGCSCLSKDGSGTLERKICSESDISKGCTNITAISSMNYTIWKGKQFCYDNKENINYTVLLNSSVNSNKTCPEGQKQCGLLDTLAHKFCVKNEDNCPINYITVNENETFAIENKTYKFTSIKLNDNKYLHYTNEAFDSYIISQLSVSDGDICIDPSEVNLQFETYLLNYYESYGCSLKYDNKTYNENYKQIDKANKYTVMNENGIIAKIGTTVFYSPDILKENQTFLYQSSYMGIKKECINKLNITKDIIARYKEIIEKVLSKGSTIFYMVMIGFVIAGINHLILIKINDFEKINMMIIKNLLFVIYSFVIFIIEVTAYSALNDITIWSGDCTDAASQPLLNNYSKLLHRNFVMLVILIIIALLPLIICALSVLAYKILCWNNIPEPEDLMNNSNYKSIEIQETKH